MPAGAAPNPFSTAPADTCPEPPVAAAGGGFLTKEQSQDNQARHPDRPRPLLAFWLHLMPLEEVQEGISIPRPSQVLLKFQNTFKGMWPCN